MPDWSKSACDEQTYSARAGGEGRSDVLGWARDFLEAGTYLEGGLRGRLEEARSDGSAAGPSDLFRATVDHLVAPYAKAVAAEGYRLSPERFAKRFGLFKEQQEVVANAIGPTSWLWPLGFPVCPGFQRCGFLSVIACFPCVESRQVLASRHAGHARQTTRRLLHGWVPVVQAGPAAGVRSWLSLHYALRTTRVANA